MNSDFVYNMETSFLTSVLDVIFRLHSLKFQIIRCLVKPFQMKDSTREIMINKHDVKYKQKLYNHMS